MSIAVRLRHVGHGLAQRLHHIQSHRAVGGRQRLGDGQRRVALVVHQHHLFRAHLAPPNQARNRLRDDLDLGVDLVLRLLGLEISLQLLIVQTSERRVLLPNLNQITLDRRDELEPPRRRVHVNTHIIGGRLELCAG